MQTRRSLGIGALALAACGARQARQDPASVARRDLYVCEGCEVVGEVDPRMLAPAAIIAKDDEPGVRMTLTGRVTALDGSPARDVVIYAHQTDAQGLYAGGAGRTGWGRRHGRLRGWVRTAPDGIYRFETIKPAPYPSMTMPAHVHLFVGEPGRPPYYVDDVVFDGEFGVDQSYRSRQELRGGSGIVRLVLGPRGGVVAVRDVRLEPHPA